jgi:ketosteroid isomerase-like protein
MSHANEEAVGRILKATQLGDFDAVVLELDPEIQIDDTDIPDGDAYRGHASFAKWLGVWNDSWETWRVEDLEIRSVGDDLVVALFLMIATGRGSGIELSRRDAIVCEFRGSKVIKIGYYNDQEQALEAAALAAA